MEKMKFGYLYINMIEKLFKNMTSCTMNRGYTKNYFKITRGLRQGDQLSAPCLDILAEVIGQKILQNKNILGIQILGNKKHAQYADDLWALLQANQSSLDEILNEFRQFERFSGLQTNYNKTQIMRIGSLRDSNAKFYVDKPIQWTDKLKILGFHINSDIEYMTKLNYDEILEKFKKTLNIWKARSLTLIGRIVVYNTLVVPIAIQKLQCLPTPTKEFFNKVRKIVTNFIWMGKKPMLAYDRLMLPYEMGGLRLADLEKKESALKCNWVIKSMANVKPNWCKIADVVLPCKTPDIWNCNTSEKDVRKIMKGESTIKDVWKAWAKYNYEDEVEDTNSILEQVIWHNTHCKRNGKPFREKKLCINRELKK